MQQTPPNWRSLFYLYNINRFDIYFILFKQQFMQENTNQPKKIVINKRVRTKDNRTSGRRNKEASLSDDNPLLSQPPSSSIGAQMLNRHSAEAKRSNELSENMRKANGIIEERAIITNNTEEAAPRNSFVASIIDRFK